MKNYVLPIFLGVFCIALYGFTISNPFLKHSNTSNLGNLTTDVNELGIRPTVGLFDNIAAKDLTIGQALEVILDYENNSSGKILYAPSQANALQNEINDLKKRNLYNEKTNKVVRKSIQLKSFLKGVAIKANLSGLKKNPAANYAYVYVEPRNAVGIIRLCEFLAKKGVVELHHAGMNFEKGRTDNHGEGRAVDFVGAKMSDGQLIYVKEDWSDQKVPVLDKYDNATDVLSETNKWPPKPKIFSKLFFRLDYNDSNDRAKEFFIELYDFVSNQYSSTQKPYRIGEMSFIMTPDHPISAPGTKNGREAHHSHIHFNIGPTPAE